MAKFTNDVVFDGFDKYIAGVAVTPDTTNDRDLCVCSAQPTTRTEAITTYMLAKTTLVKSSDFTIADDPASPYGRKVTTTQKTGVSVTNSGTAVYIAICDGTNLLIVTTCTSQVLTAGNTVTIPAFKAQVGDPT
jgi:hypothetical protein